MLPSKESAFNLFIPRSNNNSPASLGDYSAYTPSPLGSAASTPTLPTNQSSSATSSTSSTPTAYKGFEPLTLDSAQVPSEYYGFPSPAGLFVAGLLSPEEVYNLRYEIISRLASKILILFRSRNSHKPYVTYASFLKSYNNFLKTLSDYPIFLFQKLNFTVDPFQGVHYTEQDRARIDRHLETLKLDFGGNPTLYSQVNRIKIKSGSILWSTNGDFHSVHFDHKDLPNLIL